jgi:tetratricopeptide (TPR) repeat protein
MERLTQQQASQAVATGSDPQFLRFLANDYSKAGRQEAALLCLNKVVQLQASDGGAWQAIGVLKAQQGEWLEAAAAHSSAAQHVPAGAARADALLAAATAYMNAASGRGEEKVGALALPGCCLGAAWVLPGCCLGAAWVLPGLWLLLGSCCMHAC